MKRIWPSLRRVARSKTSRQVVGLAKGSKPSKINISASAPSSTSPTVAGGIYFFAGAAWAGPPPRMVRKNSLLGSSTITSLLVRKLAR